MLRPFFLQVLKVVIVILVILLGITLWIFRPFLTPSFLLGTNLIVLTNEFEARPCGGFITAFGEVQFFPPKVFLKNSYHFEGADLGPNIAPLDQVATDMKFWDLAIDTDLEQCARRIELSYESLEKKEIDHTILLNFGAVERIFALVGPMKFERKLYTKENLFAELSRKVSDVDRHDEISLQKRKSPLSRFGKKAILKSIFTPFAPIRAGIILRDEMKNGDVFVSGISTPVTPSDKDIVIREWNLGGAKSSRYLQKELEISIREEIPEEWNTNITFAVEHLGHFDEPLSTSWKGVFEVQFPEFLGGQITSIPAELAPGETLSESFEFTDIALPSNEDGLQELGIFRSRGQDLLIDLSVSAYPQQSLSKGNLNIRDNVGTYYGPVKKVSTCFGWEIEADKSAPFVTLHEVVDPSGFSDSELSQRFDAYDIVGEIHFNESVFDGEDVKVSLQDKNHANNIHNDPTFVDYEILEDQRTMILGFNQPTAQENERYFLHLQGLRDSYGNEIESGPWTLIPR